MDGRTKISVCHNKGICNNKAFKDIAKTGKNSMAWFFGFKLHTVCNEKGDMKSNR